MNNPAHEIAERLSWEIESWNSIEMFVRHELSDHSSNNQHNQPFSVSFDETYIETSTGQRFAKLLNRDPNGKDRLYASYSDGDRFVDVTHSGGEGSPQSQYVIKKAFGSEDRLMVTQRPYPLKFLYLERIPLHKLLPKADYLGVEQCLGRDCHAFLFSGVKWTTPAVELVYVLDDLTGVPLEVRCYLSQDDLVNNRPIWTWEAQSLNQVDNYHIVTESVETLYASGGTKTTQLTKQSTRLISVKDCSFNKEYSLSIFQPAIEPGAMVWDAVEGKKWLEADRESPLQALEYVSKSESLRAIPPSSKSAVMAYSGIGLGVVLLVVALASWLRR